MTLRRWLLGSVAIAALTTGLLARPGVVTHRDGNVYTGDVSEEEQGKVTVKVRGIPIAIDRRDVVSIRYVDPDEDFPKKLADLPANDFKARMDLAKWALSERKYEWAIQAAEAALKIDPNSREATDFITMTRRQRELDRAHPGNTATGTGSTGTKTGGTPTTGPGTSAPHKTLSPDDINLIRQGELRGNEEFRVQFNNDVRRKYAEGNKLSLSQFTARPPTEQAREILKYAPEHRNDVRIMSDPASITAFKRLQPTIMQGCGSAGCHSNGAGGGFVLLTAIENDATVYTNFYILNNYVKQVGTRKYSMIERTTPQTSLLLQYGLPPENADPKHPEVRGYRGIYRTPTDPRFQLVAKFLGETLAVPAPDYSAIKFEVPTAPQASPTTEPSK